LQLAALLQQAGGSDHVSLKKFGMLLMAGSAGQLLLK
jgi:hypothetical protein